MLVRIALSIILGAVLGVERGLQNRPAGLRTYILVSMGACIVMITNQYVYLAYNTGDPVRMSAQVISGIGFLGAGTIIVTKRNQIKGLTTAAGLWASACVGLAIGIGLYEVALVGGTAIFVVLRVLNHWDHYIKGNRKSLDFYIELTPSFPLGRFIRNLKECNIEPSNIQIEHDGLSEKETSFIISLRGTKSTAHDDILRTLRRMEGISYFEEL